MTRTCPKCGKDYEPNLRATGRTFYRCKKCNAAAAKIYRRQYKKGVNRRDRARYRNPLRCATFHAIARKCKLRQKYGLTPEGYDAIHAKQKGLCAVCGKPEKTITAKYHTVLNRRLIRRLAVDHCHKTGKVRGLVCSNCNRGMGMFGDDPDLMRKAINYLLISS